MSLNRYAAKRDANEPAIVRALEQVGAVVEKLKQPCDLAVRFRYRQYLIEVTNPANKYRKRSKAQLETLERLQIPIVSTVDEALRVIGVL